MTLVVCGHLNIQMTDLKYYLTCVLLVDVIINYPSTWTFIIFENKQNRDFHNKILLLAQIGKSAPKALKITCLIFAVTAPKAHKIPQRLLGSSRKLNGL